jgi:hypothetical protein
MDLADAQNERNEADAGTILELQRTQAWFVELATRWREQLTTASKSVAAEVNGSLTDIRPPARLDVFTVRGRDPPVHATLVIVRRAVPDLQVRSRLLKAQDVERLARAKRPELRMLAHLWLTMKDNWTPGRPPEPPDRRWSLMAQRGPRDEQLWLVPGDPTESPSEHVASLLLNDHRRTPELTASEVEPRAPSTEKPAFAGPHLWQAGERREQLALRRFLAMSGDQLMSALGIHSLWWCGLFLPRRDLLASGLNGDIDLLAGPLELTIPSDEWKRRIDREKNGMPLAAHPTRILELALMRACSDGLVRWPPSIEEVRAVEVKVSWYDPDKRTMKASHSNSRQRVKGQLQLLIDHGFRNVGFLHLCFTKPRDSTPYNPWFQAASDAQDADELSELVFDPSELPGCHYLKATAGALPFALEDMAGAGPSIRIVQTGIPIPLRSAKNADWKAKLASRLSVLARPRQRCAVIVSDMQGRWTFA